MRALAADTEQLEPGREDELRDQRERLRHLSELVQAAAAAADALAPEDGEGATDLVAVAERSVASVERLAPELAAATRSARRGL
jgi:DNA repair ATPase RecN